MYKEYQPDHLYQNYIKDVSCPGFHFVIHYAERMDQSIPEFSHHHDLYEIYYVMQGSVQFCCLDKVLTLNQGNVLFLGKNYDHHMIYDPQNNGTYFVLIFDVVPKNVNASAESSFTFSEIRNVLKKIDQKKYVLSTDTFNAMGLLQDIYIEQQNKLVGWDTMIGTLYLNFFLKALRLLSPEFSALQKPPGYMNVALTSTKYIHANYQNDIDIETVASLLNVTPRHLNRLLQDMFGMPFSHMVNNIRMEYSKQYLCNTDKSIECIAASVGLPSAKVLTKLFKEREGISPAKFRRLRKKNIR